MKGACTEGGVEFKGANTTLACNGVEGEPGEDGETGFTEVLPDGKTETGTWGGVINEEATAIVPISFSIPLLADTEPVLVKKGENGTPNGCPGLVSGTPQADPGKLCVYIHSEEGLPEEEPIVFPDPRFQFGAAGAAAAPSGAILFVTGCEADPCTAYGTWAVTAENTP